MGLAIDIFNTLLPDPQEYLDKKYHSSLFNLCAGTEISIILFVITALLDFMQSCPKSFIATYG